MRSDELVSTTSAELSFIAIPPSYISGEPNRTMYYGIIDKGSSIVTADKTVLAIEYQKFKEYVAKKKLFIGYRATVAAGTPVLDVARGLRKRRIGYIRGILNSTTNYILGLIEQGYTYDQAIRKTINEKLAEPDPRIDTHGYDPASKLAILLSELEIPTIIRDIRREPLDQINENDVKTALLNNYTYKYIVEAGVPQRKFIVHPIKINRTDPLAGVKGITNRVEFSLENEKIIIHGPAGPSRRTANTMITDAYEYLGLKEYRI